MKRTRLLLPILLFCAVQSFGQTQVPIEELRTPPSPAFVLLGVAPTEVERPTTPRAFGLALISAFDEANGQNVSLEVAPYWLQPKPMLTYEKYVEANFLQSLKQSFSISIATKGAEEEEEEGEEPALALEEEDDDMRFGVGVRAAHVFGKEGAASKAARQALQGLLSQASINLGFDPNLTAQQLQERAEKAVEALLASNDKTLADLTEAVADTARQGRVAVDFAAAISGRFDENEFGGRHHEKTAFWLTPSYRFDRKFVPTDAANRPATIDVLGVLRYIDDRTVVEDDGDGIDIGARFVWENDTLSLSAEHIRRTNVSEESERTAVVVEFKLNDDIYLTGTFGEDFDKPGNEGNLLALFGVNFNIGPKPVLQQ